MGIEGGGGEGEGGGCGSATIAAIFLRWLLRCIEKNDQSK